MRSNLQSTTLSAPLNRLPALNRNGAVCCKQSSPIMPNGTISYRCGAEPHWKRRWSFPNSKRTISNWSASALDRRCRPSVGQWIDFSRWGIRFLRKMQTQTSWCLAATKIGRPAISFASNGVRALLIWPAKFRYSVRRRCDLDALPMLATISALCISPLQCGFRPMPAPDSGACRASVPVDAGPRFRSMPA